MTTTGVRPADSPNEPIDHQAPPEHGDCMDMIDAYAEHMRRTSRSGSSASVTGRREILAQLDRQLKFGLGHTSQEELEDWLHGGRETRGGVTRPWSQNTKATYYSAIKAAYAFWADPRDPWITDDPTEGMAPVHSVKGTARDVTDEQLWDVLDRARDPYRLWALIAAYQGLRCCEIAGLDREHVTQQRLIVVRGKGGKPRVHDTDPLVWAAVEPLPPGPIARTARRRERASPKYVAREAARYFHNVLGMEDVTMHRFRHWLGVRTQALYRDVRVTMEVLGHESLASTQIYTKATVEQQREARSMLPRPPGG